MRFGCGLPHGSDGRRRPLGATATVAGALVTVLAALLAMPANRAAALPAPAEPAGAATWGIQPAASSGAATRPAFAYELGPGTAVDDVVRVTNFGEQPLTLRVSAHDAFNTAAGGFDVLPSDATSAEVGTWITLQSDEIVVPARGSVDVPFRLTVPSNATPGDHAGGIVASRSVATTSADGAEVLVDHRVGTRVYVRVAGPLRPALVIADLDTRFESEGLLGTGGAVVTTYTVRNTGNVRLGAAQGLAVTGPFGLGRQTVELTDVPELLPGGEYTASVTVDDVTAFGRLTSALTISASSEPHAVVAATAAAWAVPWRLLGCAAAAAFIVWRRRRLVDAGPAPDGADRQPADAPSPAATAGAILAAALLVPMATDRTDGPDVTAQVVRVEPAVVAIGDTADVALEGWPHGPVQIELCGNGARRGSLDCDQLGAVATAVGDDGTASARLPIAPPPSDCPCAVRVSQVGTGASTVVPIDVVGAGAAAGSAARPPSSDPPERRLEVTLGEVVADEGWAAWFGADVHRRLGLAVRNEGSVPLTAVSVSARLDGSFGTSIVVDSPGPFDLEPGEQREVTLGFELPVPAIGDYRLEGRIDGADEPVTFSASTSHMPWGTINALLLTAAGWVVVRARRRARRALPRAHAGTALTQPPTTGELATTHGASQL